MIVPFAELLLPVALRLFPNMLPSTYEGAKSKEAKATSLRATRKEVSSFLRQTLKESGLPVSASNAQKEEFTDFFKKVLHSCHMQGRSNLTDASSRSVLLARNLPSQMSSTFAKSSRTT